MTKRVCEILEQMNNLKERIDIHRYDLDRFESADRKHVDIRFNWVSNGVTYNGNYYLNEVDAERLFDCLKRRESLLIESYNKKMDDLVEELKGAQV